MGAQKTRAIYFIESVVATGNFYFNSYSWGFVMETLETLAKYAGIGGIAIGCSTLVFRDFLKSKYFSNVSGEHTYKLFRLLLYIVWSIALFGIISYSIINFSRENNTEPKDHALIDEIEFYPIIYFGTYMDTDLGRSFPDCRKTIFSENQFRKVLSWLLTIDGPIESIRLFGGTEGFGSMEYNQALGERCANVVAEWLQEEGIDRSVIHTLSYGEERPKSLKQVDGNTVKNLNTYVVIEVY
tara:strand:+ start:2215 stop:2937 length:723 start_codon:yes stop_codon:yes gene_type:complete